VAVSRSRHRVDDLDELIAEITVDCNDEEEALSGFEVAFDDQVCFPLAGAVVSEGVQVLSVSRGNGRAELIASCARAGRRYDITLLDVELSREGDAARLVAAYRRWLGACRSESPTLGRRVQPRRTPCASAAAPGASRTANCG
jgi:hypothetical protein